MDNNKAFELINELAQLSSDELQMVIACAKFQAYLKANVGEKIDLTTVSQFASLVGALVKAVD